MAKEAKKLEDMQTPHEVGMKTAAAAAIPLLGAANPISGVMGVGLAYSAGRLVQSYRRYKAGGSNVWGEPQQAQRHPALNDKQNWSGK